MEDKRKIVNEIREFNRFYTVFLGFLNQNYLDSGYSVTEARILFELKQNKQMSANRLIELLYLDKSYVSRLIRNFEQRGIVTREVALDDRRAFNIQLTSKGQAETDRLIEMTDNDIFKMIEPLNLETCDGLCKSMRKIREIFLNDIDSQQFRGI